MVFSNQCGSDLIKYRTISPCIVMVLWLAMPVNAAELKVIGKGQYEYQYTLYQTQADSTAKVPARNTPYRLYFLTNQLIGKRNHYHGRTDNNGKTITVRTNTVITDDRVVLVKRVGNGRFGTMYVLKNSKYDKPIEAMPYKIRMNCAHRKPKNYYGYTDAKGNTAYVTSTKACNTTLFADFTGSAIYSHLETSVKPNPPETKDYDCSKQACPDIIEKP